MVPFRGDSDMDVTIEGQAPAPPGHETTTWYRLVSADYLTAMGIPMRRGRMFAPREAAPCGGRQPDGRPPVLAG